MGPAVEWNFSTISPILSTLLLIILAYLPGEIYGSRVGRVGEKPEHSRRSAMRRERDELVASVINAVTSTLAPVASLWRVAGVGGEDEGTTRAVSSFV